MCELNPERFLFLVENKFVLITYNTCMNFGDQYEYKKKLIDKVIEHNKVFDYYELNRIMMAAASTDGTFMPDMDGESWAGRHDIAAPYTQQEADMLKMAYAVNGTVHKDLNKGDLRSQELPGTNTQSTVKPFKGYKKK
jgi:hypothetical protein